MAKKSGVFFFFFFLSSGEVADDSLFDFFVPVGYDINSDDNTKITFAFFA
jgi:hypothetical protein